MPPLLIRLAAPSRLHFGLFSFGGSGRQFGGVGVMIERPSLEVSVEPAETFSVVGPLSHRARKFANAWAQFYSLAEPPPCVLTIHAAPPEHVGLGTGTQLGLSVAAALYRFTGQPLPGAAELAASVGRGLRSAVGTYGFLAGGLIVERGKLPGELLSPLDCRLDLPAEWRFVLLRPATAAAVFGDDERLAFAQLPAVPADVTAQLIAEVRDRLVPAAARGEFDEFSESMFQFGRLAGACFAARQGGPYNGPQLAALVELVQSLGVCGVGQSSWGPTLFALSPDQASADQFVAKLRAACPGDELNIEISPPSNSGVCVEVEE